ncbi:MAG TPA: class I SAM-dependent methyltransferase, partial [Actinomycetota bacterium]|nr:class I SAM-dependent methyltransferase [Actinomycetota bacterium]
YRLIPMADLAGGEIGPASGGSGRQARERYQDDVVEALALGVRGLPRGGPIAVVANDRHNLYPVIRERLGVEPVAEVRRNVGRRTGLRTGGFGETIFIWRKP